MPVEALKRSATLTSFDPLTLLPALAVVTERIGLIGPIMRMPLAMAGSAPYPKYSRETYRQRFLESLYALSPMLDW
jgi:hypothetical protein